MERGYRSTLAHWIVAALCVTYLVVLGVALYVFTCLTEPYCSVFIALFFTLFFILGFVSLLGYQKGRLRFAKSMGLFLGGTVLLLMTLFLANEVARCPAAIYGDEETVGATIYISGDLVGVMKKNVDQSGIAEVSLCTWFKKGDLLRAEKEGYKTYTATLEPSYDDSSSPHLWVWIKLTPLDERKQSPNH